MGVHSIPFLSGTERGEGTLIVDVDTTVGSGAATTRRLATTEITTRMVNALTLLRAVAELATATATPTTTVRAVAAGGALGKALLDINMNLLLLARSFGLLTLLVSLANKKDFVRFGLLQNDGILPFGIIGALVRPADFRERHVESLGGQLILVFFKSFGGLLLVDGQNFSSNVLNLLGVVFCNNLLGSDLLTLLLRSGDITPAQGLPLLAVTIDCLTQRDQIVTLPPPLPYAT